MQSVTSYFKTLVRSDLRHYWPVCFGYTFIWILVLPVMLLQKLPDAEQPLTAAANILSEKSQPALCACRLAACSLKGRWPRQKAHAASACACCCALPTALPR